jgi:23S rRNA (uracil1939-C5)-methyltransferase
MFIRGFDLRVPLSLLTIRIMSQKKPSESILEVQFHGIADKGQCVGKSVSGETVFAVGPIPGDKALIKVFRKRKGFYKGIVMSYITLSSDRIDPTCIHFSQCGGCKWQHLSYKIQLEQKEKVVKDAISRIGKLTVDRWHPILGADPIYFYRNKMEFTFSNRRWLTDAEIALEENKFSPVLGFHPPGAFDKVIDIQHCSLQQEPANHIRNTIRSIALSHKVSFYDPRNHEGFMRTLLLRVTTLGEIMVVIAFGEDDAKKISLLLQEIQIALPEITSLYYCINTKMNDSLYDLDMHHLAGKATIHERLGHVTYKIGPKSFFQTNTRQAVNLYNIVKEFANLNGSEIVYDLYTGLGSIALYLAAHAKHIIGIEEIAAAIEDAKMNASDNHIENVDFIAGDVRFLFHSELIQQFGKPDLIITDPPRAGMHPEVVAVLLAVEAPKIIYVSCDPATHARDLNILSEKYHILQMQAVDMFPHTHHIENVALLSLK